MGESDPSERGPLISILRIDDEAMVRILNEQLEQACQGMYELIERYQRPDGLIPFPYSIDFHRLTYKASLLALLLRNGYLYSYDLSRKLAQAKTFNPDLFNNVCGEIVTIISERVVKVLEGKTQLPQIKQEMEDAICEAHVRKYLTALSLLVSYVLNTQIIIASRNPDHLKSMFTMAAREARALSIDHIVIVNGRPIKVSVRRNPQRKLSLRIGHQNSGQVDSSIRQRLEEFNGLS